LERRRIVVEEKVEKETVTFNEEEISFTSSSSVTMIMLGEKVINFFKNDIFSPLSSFVDKEEITFKEEEIFLFSFLFAGLPLATLRQTIDGSIVHSTHPLLATSYGRPCCQAACAGCHTMVGHLVWEEEEEEKG
jgi:hypothetical protein